MPERPPTTRAGGGPAVATAERVATVVRDLIVTGELPSGTPLREAALAADLDVSRNTLREGLRLLAAQGLVTQHLYRGAVVATLTTQRIRDIYTARRAVELHAIEESARASDDQFAAMDAAVAGARRSVARQEGQEVGTASLRFHQAVVALLGSEVLDEFFAQIVAQLRLAFGVAGEEPDFQAGWIDQDAELARLIGSGRRAQARQLMSRYLDDSEAWVLDAVRSAERDPDAGRISARPAGLSALRGEA